MRYIESNLMEGEQVVYRTRIHWIVFLWPLVWLALGILVAQDMRAGVSGFFLLIGIISCISALINFLTSEFGITNKRIIAKSGFIRRNSLELFLNKLESVQVNQGIVGRLFNYGTVVVTGTGGTKSKFPKVAKPLALRNEVQRHLSTFQS
ncbi:MAG: MFS transporter permease [Elusimicrobia bacterium CG_4_10_14_0_8_um_filter_37_32]|nr:MAG: MFS transporter permease [Elusimicrobia bacterium CG_4_10_14_0_8_um_filter_37_32]